MEEYTNVIYIIIGLGALIAAFKSIDWLISTKYRTKDDCENCRKVIYDVINKDRDLLTRLDAKMDIVLEIIRGNNDTKL